MSTPAERARTLRKRHQRERQAVVFGSLVAGLGVIGLGAAAVYTDVIPADFLDRSFSSAASTETGSTLPPAPCPPAGTLPVTYNVVTVNVLNASIRAGLAGQTATQLSARGFVLGTTGNATGSAVGPEEIRFGEAGIAAAYTLASNFADPVLVLDTREDASVDLLLGDTYPGLIDAASVALDPSTPLVGVGGCVALEEARKDALAGPTPSPSPTDPAVDQPPETVEETPTTDPATG